MGHYGYFCPWRRRWVPWRRRWWWWIEERRRRWGEPFLFQAFGRQQRQFVFQAAIQQQAFRKPAFFRQWLRLPALSPIIQQTGHQAFRQTRWQTGRQTRAEAAQQTGRQTTEHCFRQTGHQTR